MRCFGSRVHLDSSTFPRIFFIFLIFYSLHLLTIFLYFRSSPSAPPSLHERNPHPLQSKTSIAFITYELYPVSRRGGGAGVVINGLIMDLLENGHNVAVIADFEEEALQEWKLKLALESKNSSSTGTLHARSLASLVHPHSIQLSNSIFINKSRLFALALGRLYSGFPFDIVECFDYAGVAYELLRMKPPGILDYLPDSVAVSIRLHGTLQLIDRAEHNEDLSAYVTERNLMYLQEQFAIAAADFLFCQTRFMIDKLSDIYGLDEGEVSLAPAPLESILKYVDAALAQDTTVPTWESNRRFLIYGRLQLVKGLELIVQAALTILQSQESQTSKQKIEFMFVGPDMELFDKPMMTSEYLKTLIPDDQQSHFIFHTKPVDRQELVKYSKEVYAAIFASKFEALNLAVHEIFRMNVPLILSRIPAFEEYFGSIESVSFFTVSDSNSLQQALESILFTPEGQAKVELARSGKSRITYMDATSVYSSFNVPVPPRRWSTKSLLLDGLIREKERLLNERR